MNHELPSRIGIAVVGTLVGLGFLSNGLFAPYSITTKVVMVLIGLLVIAGRLAVAIRNPKNTEPDSS